MKTIFTTLFAISLTILISAFSGPRPEAAYSITAEVTGLRNADGILQFALYNTKGSIPDEHYRKYYRLLKTEITNRSAKITFQDVPAGIYAVNIFHDENGNGKIDKGFLLPKEGIGFSNYESIGLRNKPSFEKASFRVEGDTSIVIKVIYM